jgi:hypothetical protein
MGGAENGGPMCSENVQQIKSLSVLLRKKRFKDKLEHTWKVISETPVRDMFLVGLRFPFRESQMVVVEVLYPESGMAEATGYWAGEEERGYNTFCYDLEKIMRWRGCVDYVSYKLFRGGRVIESNIMISIS